MPHIVIKTLSGKPQQQLEEAAEQAIAAVGKVFGNPNKKFFSASVEEYSREEWETVYNETIKDKDNVIIKPGYSNPKTFE